MTVYRVYLKRNDGATRRLLLRGPRDETAAEEHALRILDAQSRRAGHALDFAVDAVERVGADASPVGAFRPDNATSIDLNHYATKAST